MTLSLRPISQAAIPRALEKAERYRLLNEPAQAESICRDILSVDPAHQGALVMLVLALADQLDARSADGVRAAEAVIERLEGDYERTYYRGIVHERWARALVKHGDRGDHALGWLHDAMHCFESAARLPHATGNDDANLRYNACVRLIEGARLEAPADHLHSIDHGDAVPPRR